tara:strand:+ start:1137 stop:2117 length:981 start_codon:yes stop_codon:yes gene_type:complete
MKISNEVRPKKHGARWTADDSRYLTELWYDQTSIEDIADTLERTQFAIVCQLAWKVSAKLSTLLSQIDDEELTNRTKGLYITDYPELVDVEVDQSAIKNELAERERIRTRRNEKLQELIKGIDIKSKDKDQTGLEELVILVFSSISHRSLSIKELKERIVWIVGIASLFSDLEYEALFGVYSDKGPKKTYKQVSEELDIKKYIVEHATRTSVRRIINMLEFLKDDINNYSSWIQIDSLTYANIEDTSAPVKFPKVQLDFENVPRELFMIEDFELTKTEVEKLHKANIFCISNLKNYTYQDLRLTLKLESDIARKIMEKTESVLLER